MQTAVEWARENAAHFTYCTALDNFEPVARAIAYGNGWAYTSDGQPRIVLENVELKDATKAVYLIDDGRTVEAFYVAGWGEGDKHLILSKFPTNHVDANGRRVDHSTWQLGPRRAYHLKVQFAPNPNDQ